MADRQGRSIYAISAHELVLHVALEELEGPQDLRRLEPYLAQVARFQLASDVDLEDLMFKWGAEEQIPPDMQLEIAFMKQKAAAKAAAMKDR